MESLKRSLEAAEADLRRRSKSCHRHVQAERTTAEAVAKGLARRRRDTSNPAFQPRRFRRNAFGELHLLALMLEPGAAAALFDLGEARPILDAQQELIHARSTRKRCLAASAVGDCL